MKDSTSEGLLFLTSAALTELKRIAQEENQPLRVRIAFKGGGCSGMTIDMSFTKFPKDDEFDLTLTQDGIEFIVDNKSVLYIRGATLDYSGNLLDKGFSWSFPDSTGSCGCGVSFSF